MENITLDTHYTRSINLERDAESSDILRAYIPTTRAIETLEKIANTFTQHNTQRAWALVGPYGAGKSSFATFLAHLLENQRCENHQIAQQLLQHHAPLTHAICRHTQNTNAYCIVLLTGSPEPLNKRFIVALYRAALSFLPNESAELLAELEHAQQSRLTTSQIIGLVEKLKQEIAKTSGKGILIVIDELGKFLEYEARHQGNSDIFLLQQLAELSYQGGETTVLLLVLMHQAFEQYAKGLGETLKNEWSKVQGRFESIAFLESAGQTLRLIAAAIHNELPEAQNQQIKQHTDNIVRVLAAQNALFFGLSADSASDILARCYPLHPIAALLLPILCQKVAQNERTLFSYLGSGEIFGFQNSLSRLQQGNWVLPWKIFQYFIENQPLATADPITHRRWAEVITAVERLGDVEEAEMQLLKTIGLFNIIGNQAGFKASGDLLRLCFPASIAVDNLLERLQHKSIINYRKFNAEYRIWQGSDFDLDIALRETRQQLERFDLAEVLNKKNPLPPLVARKYSIEKATLRYFQARYATRLNSVLESRNEPRIIFFLAENQDECEFFNELIKNYNPLTLYVLCDNAQALKALVGEVIALEHIQTQYAEIKSDPVAQRELKDRLLTSKQRETELLRDYTEKPENNQWFHQGEKIALTNRKELQNKLSQVLESVYCHAPIIKNELINRDKPSGQANAAKNKLITALLNHSDKDDLGFDSKKYPPEKTIYRALFKETGIHVNKNGVWILSNPLPDNKYHIAQVWQGMDSFLKNDNAPKKLTDLYQYIESPPYGLKKGVSSLLFMAYYLTNQKILALYESGIFCPVISIELFEILSKRPELFSIEAIDLEGIKAELFNGYLETLIGKVEDDNSLLDIVKRLAKFIDKLPYYTRVTKSLDQKTQNVRNAFQHIQSPVQLLFEVLPHACGYESYQQGEPDKQATEAFLKTLANCLIELNKAYSLLLADFQIKLASALKESPNIELAELRIALKKYAGLAEYTNDQSFKAFINRLYDNKENDTAWLESIAALLAGVPPNKWTAQHKTTAIYRLNELSQRLEQLALFHTLQDNEPKNSKITVLRFINEQGEKSKRIHPSDESAKKADSFINKLIENGFKIEDEQLRLAIVARLLAI